MPKVPISSGPPPLPQRSAGSRTERDRTKTRQLLRIDLALLLAGALCGTAFVVELSRARHGNALSWVYVVEWPIFLLVSVDLWRRMRRAVSTSRRQRSLREALSARPESTRAEIAEGDPGLVAWNDYVRALKESDEHPAGPPSPERR